VPLLGAAGWQPQPAGKAAKQARQGRHGWRAWNAIL